MEEATLKRVRCTVFGDLVPQHVIVSTPNSEYNVLFPNFSGFRHWDHKFEWTRCEFSQWCTSICDKYPYSVELTGLGDPTVGFEHVGFCTQVAIFTRHARSSDAEEVWQSKRSAIGEPYVQVHSTSKTANCAHTDLLCLKWIMSSSGEATLSSLNRLQREFSLWPIQFHEGRNCMMKSDITSLVWWQPASS